MPEKLNGVFRMQGVPQNYAWGGKDYISDLFELEKSETEVIAEYWIGTHHRGAARIEVLKEWQELNAYTKLPFLLKILDVNSMLSIQSHPNKAQAAAGFDLENEASIPLDAKHRIFKDDNHKPELMVALSDFWLLHGFKSEDLIRETIQSTKGFESLESHLENGIQSLFSYVMKLNDDEIEKMLNPLRNYLLEQEISNKNEPGYWAKKAFATYGYDRGIFGIYFFNLVYLETWQGIYQEAGIPHAYLEGKNIELMANSDNVFRAGLTPKHIDVPVLLNHLDFTEVIPHAIDPEVISKSESYYPSPAQEFELHLIRLDDEDYTIQTKNEECYLILDGEFELVTDNALLYFRKGQSFYSSAGQCLIFKPLQKCLIVRAV